MTRANDLRGEATSLVAVVRRGAGRDEVSRVHCQRDWIARHACKKIGSTTLRQFTHLIFKEER
jgi:hypothetical protein